MTVSTYTRYVRVLRLVLPALAVCGFIGLLVWPWWQERLQMMADRADDTPHAAEPLHPATTTPTAPAPLQVEKPDYQGIDAQGRPYRITAARVEQNLNPKAPITLIEPLAMLTLSDDSAAQTPAQYATLQADHGIYDAQAQTLDLRGAVALTYPGDYRITTQDLAVDIAAGIAMTTTPVTGHGPRGFLSGQSLNITDKGARIVLQGPSRLVFQPATDQQPPAAASSPAPVTPGL